MVDVARVAGAATLVGVSIERLLTPALLLDLDAVEHNIREMSRRVAGRVALRPHVKNFRCVELARRQIAAGAIGVTAATVIDARAMLEAGIPEVLLANQLVEPAKLDHLLVDLPLGARPILTVDSEATVAAAARAAERAGIVVDVVIEIDVGMTRGGTRDVAESLRLAERIAGEPALRLVGVAGYEGHSVLIADPEARDRTARAANELLATHVVALREADHELAIVSAGGTNTHLTTASHPLVTELQVGTYVGLDVGYEPYIPGFRVALSTLAQVVAVHGDRIVLDAGVKSIGASALALPRSRDPRIEIERVNDEHTLASVTGGASAPAVGERIRVDVAAAGPAVLANSRFLVVREDRVVDVWPMIPRVPLDPPPDSELPQEAV